MDGSIIREGLRLEMQIGSEYEVGYQKYGNKKMKEFKKRHAFDTAGTFDIVGTVDTVIDLTAEITNDLKAQSIKLKAGAHVGEPIDIEFTAKNMEAHEVPNVKMSIDISGPKRSSDQKTVNFSPQSTARYAITKTHTETGTYTVEGFVDSSGGVNETDERNNKISKKIIVLPKKITSVTGLKKTNAK